MAVSYIDSLQNARLDQITLAIDAGAGAGLLRIYDGTPPASADTALSGNTLLAELTMSDPSAAAAAATVWTANTITQDASADASGTASFFRVLDSDLNVVLQGSVTGPGGGGDLELNPVTITALAPVSVSSFTITEGNP